MRTEKAKKKTPDHKGNMRVVMAFLDLYDACLKNAEALLNEATLLFRNRHVARAFVLAHTGWEEIGKSQLVADFLNRMVSQDEFEAAFRDHRFKSAYNWRKFVLNANDLSDSTIQYDRGRADAAWLKRNAALHVQKQADFTPLIPEEQISKAEARSIIEALRKELEQIRRYDALTERVGSASFLK